MLENTIRSETLYKLKEQVAVQTILSLIPPNFSIRHIKAHQDDNVSYNNLSLNDKLNVDADYIATNHTSIPINTHLLIPPFVIYLNNKCIHQRIENQIRVKIDAQEAQDYLKQIYRWNFVTFNNIAWLYLYSSINNHYFIKYKVFKII